MKQWRRLHRARGHVPPTFTNGWAREAPWVEEQQTRNLVTITLTKTANYFYSQKGGGARQKIFSALCARPVPPPLTFIFVSVPLLVCYEYEMSTICN